MSKKFKPHHSWGNSIYFLGGAPAIKEDILVETMKGYTVTGHKPASQMPKKGDELEVEYHKYIVTFKLFDIDVMRDPADQFFCKADLMTVTDYSGNVVWQRQDLKLADKLHRKKVAA